NTEHRENEIVFALIPHIVREPDITAINQKALEVGTASAIALRRVSHPQAPAVQPAPAAAPQGAQAQPPANQQQASVQTPAVSSQPATSGAPSFIFDPPAIKQAPGSTFTVNVLLSGAQNVYAVPLQVSYDPKVLQVVNVSNGGFLSQDGQAVSLVHRDDDSSGALQITATRPPGSGGVSGQGSVVTLTFMAKAG